MVSNKIYATIQRVNSYIEQLNDLIKFQTESFHSQISEQADVIVLGQNA